MRITIRSVDIEQLLDVDDFLRNEGYETANSEDSFSSAGLNFGLAEIGLFLQSVQSVFEIISKVKDFVQESNKSQNNFQNTETRKQITFIISKEDNSQVILNASMNDDEIEEIIKKFF